MSKYTGIVLYEGPSVLDGEPIVAILTLHSGNEKTGDMCQTWIMRQDMPPTDASKVGADESVCGRCPHRHHLDGMCYVVLHQAPLQVWKAWKVGRYPTATKRHINRLRGRAVRLGAYGDPGAVPAEVWQPVVAVASFTTGYTHQAHRLHGEQLSSTLKHCMVSADSEAEALLYQSLGGRTFRVKWPEDPLLEGEVYCPADSHSNIQCIDCGICSGSRQKGPSVAINAHGQRAKRIAAVSVA